MHHKDLCATVFVALGTFAAAAFGQSSDTGWQLFRECPVLVEHSVDVPALDSGVLQSLDVLLNGPVVKGAVIARLDSELAALEVQLAKLQAAAATELANDNSDIEYQQQALKEVEEELRNFKSISTSVSEGEIRRLNLAVGKARLAVIRAQKAQSRAKLEEQLKQAAVESAEQRLKRREIVVPLDGVVATIYHHPGQWIQAGEPVVQVLQLDHLIVDRLVPIQEVDLTTIVGSEVRVEVPVHLAAGKSGPGSTSPTIRLSGKVTSYDPAVSSQGNIRLHARVANVRRAGHWVLLPGMNVNMYLAPRQSPQDVTRNALLRSQRNKS